MVSASLQEVFHYLAVARAIDSEMIKCGEQSIKRHGIRDKAIISQGRVVQQEKLLHAIGRPRAKEISMFYVMPVAVKKLGPDPQNSMVSYFVLRNLRP